MPFDPATDIPEKIFWYRAKDHAAGAVTTLIDASGNGLNATGSGGTIVTGATPSGGKALSGTNMGYVPSSNWGMPHSTLIPLASTELAGYSAARAVDGNNTVDAPWAATTTTGTFRVQQRSGTPIVATSYQITGTGTFTAQNPSAWTFQGSMNGSSWTTLDTRSGITSWASMEEKTFSFSNSTAYIYYRLNITANNGDLSNLAFNELKLNNVANVPQGGELWVVLKTNGGSGPQSWKYGTDATASHYTYGGDVYDDTGATTRKQFTPTVSPASWRIYRVVVNGTNWSAYLDNILQLTTASSVARWKGDPRVLDTFSGQVAEIMFVAKPLVRDLESNFYGYLNTEHGLTVVGAAGAQHFATAADVSGSSVSGNVNPVSLGSIFTYAAGGVITSLRLYANVAGTYKMRLQDGSGTVLATPSNQVVSTPGWVDFPIDPVAVAPGLNFVAVGFFPSGQWRQIAMSIPTVRYGIGWQGSLFTFAADITNPTTSDASNYYLVDVGFVTDPTMLGHWKLDDSSGSAIFAEVAYGRNATVAGVPTFGGPAAAIGIPGTSVALASPGGVHQYGAIAVPPWLRYAREISIKGWFKTSNAGNQAMFAMDNVFSSPGSGDRKFNLYINAGKVTWMSFTSAGGFPYCETAAGKSDGVWHQVWATRSATTLKSYIDGASAASGAVGGTLSGTNVNLTIGQITGLNSEFLGSLDDFEVWSGEKNATEVAASFAAETSAKVTATRSSTWNVAAGLAPVSATRSSTWKVRATVTGSRSSTWRVGSQVSGSRSSTWRVRTTVFNTRSSTWKVQASIVSTRSSTWKVRATVTSSRSSTWETFPFILPNPYDMHITDLKFRTRYVVDIKQPVYHVVDLDYA